MGRGKGRREGKGERGKKENKSTKANEGGKKYVGKGNEKKMDKGTNAKELRNFGISLIIHDRRLSGVYILI